MGLLRFTVLGHSVRLGREGTAGEDSDWQAHHNHSEETETVNVGIQFISI